MTAVTEKLSKQQTKRPRAKKKSVYICIDLGTSLIKVVYLIDNLWLGYLEIAPETTRLPAASAARLPVQTGLGLPEDTAWLRYSQDSECHLVGSLAREYKAFAPIKTLKSQMATPKILSAIAIVLERENLKPSGVKLAVLGILLPFEEMSAQDELSVWLKQILEVGFYWRERRIKIALAKSAICIAPETSGLMLDDRQKYPEMLQQDWGYLMGGEKHSSYAHYRHGVHSRINSGSKDLGFFNLNELMSERVAGWNPKHLQIALSPTLPDERKLSAVRCLEMYSTQPLVDWQKIARLRKAIDINAQIAKLERAYSESLEAYWFAYRNWLVETAPSPDEIDVLIFAGGTCQLLKPQLDDYFASTPSKFWTLHAKEVVQALGITESYSLASRSFFKKNYHVRYADVVKYLLVLTGYQPENIDDK